MALPGPWPRKTSRGCNGWLSFCALPVTATAFCRSRRVLPKEPPEDNRPRDPAEGPQLARSLSPERTQHVHFLPSSPLQSGTVRAISTAVPAAAPLRKFYSRPGRCVACATRSDHSWWRSPDICQPPTQAQVVLARMISANISCQP